MAFLHVQLAREQQNDFGFEVCIPCLSADGLCVLAYCVHRIVAVFELFLLAKSISMIWLLFQSTLADHHAILLIIPTFVQ